MVHLIYLWIFKLVFLPTSPTEIPANQSNSELITMDTTVINQKWTTIDSLLGKRLYRSADQELEELFKLLNTGDFPIDLVVYYSYKATIIHHTEEDGQYKSLEYLEDKISETKDITQSLLRVIQATNLKQFAQNNSYSITQSDIERSAPGDIRQWTMSEFLSQSSSYLLQAVEDKDLKTYSIDNAKKILNTGEFGDSLVTNLNELVLHHALLHFSSPVNYMHVPVTKFRMDNADYLLPFDQFEKLTIDTGKSQSDFANALKLFQKSIRHYHDRPDAMVYFDLKRLRLVKTESSLPQKDSLYEVVLKEYFNRFSHIPSHTEVAAALANHYFELSNLYDSKNPLTDKYRYKLKEALEMAEQAIEKYPDSYGAGLCRQIISNIKRPHANLHITRFNAANKHTLGAIEYKNLDTVKINYYKLSESEYDELSHLNFRDLKSFFDKQTVFRSQSLHLPVTDDYRTQLAEFAIDPLEKGFYVAVPEMLDNDETGYRRNFASIFITDIDLISRNEPNQTISVWVLDRATGSPLKAASVQLTEYNYRNHRTSKVLSTKTTDDDGRVVFQIPRDKAYQIRAEHEGNVIKSERGLNYYDSFDHEKRSRDRVSFFTDRSLYRPGQIVYFKGIAFTNSGEMGFKVLPKRKVTVSLQDANYKTQSEVELVSNEFGSFSGSFVLPSGALTGNFSIRASDNMGSTSFSVEEYKRPRFEVNLTKPEKALAINTEVNIPGKAMMFAGSPVRNAKVDFVVKRTTRFFNFPWSFRSFPGRSQTEDIAIGETTTDEDGAFTITFVASEDPSISGKIKPGYIYEVVATVTDVNGETRTGLLSLNLQQNEYVVQIDKSNLNSVLADQLKQINFTISSIHHEKPDIDAHLTVVPLQAPATILNDRKWSEPTQFLMSEAEFKQKFPNQPYKDEHQPENWTKKPPVLSIKVNPSKTNTLNIDASQWKTGMYELTLWLQDSKGNRIEDRIFMEVYNTAIKGNNGFNASIKSIAKKSTVEPGEEFEMFLFSQQEKQCVFITVEKENKIFREGWKKVDGNYAIQVPVSEADRGNFFIHYFYREKGELKSETHSVIVPWTNRQLTVERTTVRDKLLPGAHEKWSFQIKYADQRLRPTEALVGMYDASLDALRDHSWNRNNYTSRHARYRFNTYLIARHTEVLNYYFSNWKTHYPKAREIPSFRYDLFLPGFHHAVYQRDLKGAVAVESPPMAENEAMADGEESLQADQVQESAQVIHEEKPIVIAPRVNLNETVFFYPTIKPDDKGNFNIEFTMNEALTRWRTMMLVHDKDLSMGYGEFMVETQKDVMVFPNLPRFLRQSDSIVIVSKIENLSDKTLNVSAHLSLTDAVRGTNLIDWVQSNVSEKIDIQSKSSADVSWTIAIPEDFSGSVKMVFSADGGEHTDAEEHTLAVLSNKQWVTESFPLWANPESDKSFMLNNIKNNYGKNGRTGSQFTLEITDNPAWYAVMALPTMMEGSNAFADAIIGRFYANSIARHIVTSNPVIKSVFAEWKSADVLISELEKNESLKSILLEATPWIRQAEDEAAQRKRIALLFEMNTMSERLSSDLNELQNLQTEQGGFPWFQGGRPNWYTTQNVLEHLGHLDKLGVKDVREDQITRQIIQRAIGYTDRELIDHYQRKVKQTKDGKLDPKVDHLNPTIIHYLYVRTFFPEILISQELRKITEFYLDQCEKHYLTKSFHQQALIALSLHRNMRTKTSKDILKMLKENTLRNEELGAYWNYTSSFYWYTVPVEAHTTLMEAFTEIEDDTPFVNELKKWLLKQKQTQAWKTGKSTAKAIYALLNSGDNWLDVSEYSTITLSGKPLIVPAEERESGTGYFKKTLTTAEFSPQDPSILINNPNKQPIWGGFYWQYFQDMDKISAYEDSPMKVRKTLHKKTHTDDGIKLIPLGKDASIKVGDIVTIRLEISVDRIMEFIQLSDMRAAGFEPVEVLSGYRYKGGLGFYQSIKDTGVNYFFDYISPGSYVFEYDVRAFNSGHLVNGNATIQSAYAPEFSGHSAGQKIIISK